MVRRARDEQGAVAVFVAIVLSLLLVASAFAVDLGMQRAARADMQAVADAVALDLARELDGRTATELGTLQSAADASRDRNEATSLGSEPVVQPELGVVNPATGVFTPASGATVPNAVRVTASTVVDFAFGVAADGGAQRSAIAMANPDACLRLGSTLLDLQSGNSALLNAVLGDILNGSVNLTAVSYQGLAGAEVILADLAAALGAGTATELLATSVSLGTFFAAVADVLRTNGSTTQADVIDATLLGALGAGVGLGNVAVGQLLALGPGGDAALGASVDALSLLTTSAFVANGQNAISVPGLALGVPGVGTATASVQVIEPPRLACGSALAETSQVRVTLVLNASVLGVVNARITTTLNLGNASGSITAIECDDGEATSLEVALAPPSVLSLATTLRVDLLGLLPVTEVSVPGTVPSKAAGRSYELELPLRYDTPLTSDAGSGTLGLPNLTAAELKVLGLDITGLAFLLVRPVVVPLLNSLLDGVESLLLGTVSSTLGLRLGNADMYGVRTAQCLNPVLVD